MYKECHVHVAAAGASTRVPEDVAHSAVFSWNRKGAFVGGLLRGALSLSAPPQGQEGQGLLLPESCKPESCRPETYTPTCANEASAAAVGCGHV